MLYAVAGGAFGFVLGYMVANLGGGEARPVPALPAAGETASAPARPGGAGLDPNELRALQSLAEKDKTNVQVRSELGNLMMDHARYDEAARWYREVLALRPEELSVMVDLGACLVEGGKPVEGLAEFEKALKKDPTHKKAGFNKGVALLKLGRGKEAAAVWEELLKRYPGDPSLQGLKEKV